MVEKSLMTGIFQMSVDRGFRNLARLHMNTHYTRAAFPFPGKTARSARTASRRPTGSRRPPPSTSSRASARLRALVDPSTISWVVFVARCSRTVTAPEGQRTVSRVDLLRRAQADQEPRVVGRLDAAPALALAVDRPPADLDLDAGADGVAVAPGPDQLEADPVVVDSACRCGGGPAGPSLWLTTMSMSPSSSRSPNAAPRPTWLGVEVGPGVAGGEPEPPARSPFDGTGRCGSSVGGSGSWRRARSVRLSSTWPLATKLSGQPSLSKSARARAPADPRHGVGGEPEERRSRP